VLCPTTSDVLSGRSGLVQSISTLPAESPQSASACSVACKGVHSTTTSAAFAACWFVVTSPSSDAYLAAWGSGTP
jgi:hypothetical protein